MDQRLLYQREQQIPDLLRRHFLAGNHGANRGERGFAQEHRHPGEQRLFHIAEQAVAPFDQSVERLLARQGGAATAGQETEALIKAASELIDGQHFEPRHRQLDRQGDAIEPAADRRDGSGIGIGESEPAAERVRPLHEQTHGGVVARALRGGRFAGLRRRQRGHANNAFPCDRHSLTARCQDRQVGAAAHQRFGNARGFSDDVLAIIDDQKKPFGLKAGCERVQCAGGRAQTDAQDIGDDGRYELRVIQRGELGEPHAVGVAIEQAAAGLDREPGLADPAGAGERYQTVIAQPRLDLREIGFAADQTGQLLGKIIGSGTDVGTRRRALVSHCRCLDFPSALACDRGHEAIAASGDCEQIAVAVACRREHLAHRGNVNLNIVFFHHHAGPDLGHQLVLGHQLAVPAHQQQQDFERALPERDRDTVGQQFAPRGQQSEWSKGESFAHWRSLCRR